MGSQRKLTSPDPDLLKPPSGSMGRAVVFSTDAQTTPADVLLFLKTGKNMSTTSAASSRWTRQFRVIWSWPRPNDFLTTFNDAGHKVHYASGPPVFDGWQPTQITTLLRREQTPYAFVYALPAGKRVGEISAGLPRDVSHISDLLPRLNRFLDFEN
jgi:hypothetical protein